MPLRFPVAVAYAPTAAPVHFLAWELPFAAGGSCKKLKINKYLKMCVMYVNIDTVDTLSRSFKVGKKKD